MADSTLLPNILNFEAIAAGLETVLKQQDSAINALNIVENILPLPTYRAVIEPAIANEDLATSSLSRPSLPEIFLGVTGVSSTYSSNAFLPFKAVQKFIRANHYFSAKSVESVESAFSLALPPPPEGSSQALITNGTSDFGSAVAQDSLETFLGLAPGFLDLLGNGDVTEGTVIQQTFSATAGDVLTFDWNFLTNESTPSSFNDFAFFSITPIAFELADTGSAFSSSASEFASETGYQTEAIALTQTGDYTISFGVFDVGDTTFDSALLVDNLQLTGSGSLKNGGFETGSFSGWQTIGDARIDGLQTEPNDTISEATSTGLIGTGSFEISSEIGDNPNVSATDDVDLFELQLNVGDQVVIDIDADEIGSTLDPILSVFTENGTLGLQNDDFDGLDSFIEFTAPFTGSYYVGVSSYANFTYDPLVEWSGAGDSTGFYDLSIDVNPGDVASEFNLEVAFIDNTLTASQQAVFIDAAERWEEIIVGDIPDVVVAGLGLVDDIVIDASAPIIDGVGGILGQAGPTLVRSDSFLPARGIMEFDAADLADLEADGLFETVILHEMGHVLGFGTIWESLDLLEDANTADPIFVGAGATAEYNSLFGVDEFGVPVEADGGPGTALGHWDDETFDNELMTGFINSGFNPLSRLTIASMGDLGYEVNLDAADPYLPPSLGAASSQTLDGLIMPMDYTLAVVDPIGLDSTVSPSPTPII